jgi:hypothetical protein
MNTISKLRSIIEEAPEGASHYDEEQTYWKFQDEKCLFYNYRTKGNWKEMTWDFYDHLHCLKDLRGLVKKEERIIYLEGNIK